MLQVANKILEHGGTGLAFLLAYMAYLLIKNIRERSRKKKVAPGPSDTLVIAFMFFALILMAMCVLLLLWAPK